MTHTCHAIGCQKTVPPKMFMCLMHWRMLPRTMQREIWRCYRPGQEIDKQPSDDYLAAAKRAISRLYEIEQEQKP